MSTEPSSHPESLEALERRLHEALKPFMPNDIEEREKQKAAALKAQRGNLAEYIKDAKDRRLYEVFHEAHRGISYADRIKQLQRDEQVLAFMRELGE